MVGRDIRLCAVPTSKHRSHCTSQAQQSTYCRREMTHELSGGSIASEVYLRLPREIRNRVYLYCVQGSYDNEVIVRRAAGSKDKCKFLVRHPTGERSYHWAEDPVTSMIDAQHLGTEVAREMLETYYWTRTFKFSHYESLLLISFLTTDTFGLDMFPADYARHLHLRIHPQNYAYGSREMKALEIEKCLLAIKALAAVRSPCTEIVVNMDLTSCSCDDIDGEDILADLLPDMEQMTKSLNDRRLRTKIAYSRDWDQ